MATIITADGKFYDTAGAYIIEQELDHVNLDDDDRVNYADHHGTPVEDIMHRAGYTV
jgi:hypothetical protein